MSRSSVTGRRFSSLLSKGGGILILMERDANWLKAERTRLLSTWSREKAIKWLAWCDPNGVWYDEDMEAQDMDPMDLEEAVDHIMSFVAETGETPEEMMGASAKANPGRYIVGSMDGYGVKV